MKYTSKSLNTEQIEKEIYLEDDFQEMTGAELYKIDHAGTSDGYPSVRAFFTKDGKEYKSNVTYTVEHFFKATVSEIAERLIENAQMI